MKILFTVYSPLGIGGAEVSTKILAEALRKKHEVFFASTGDYEGFRTFKLKKFKGKFLFGGYNHYLENYFSSIINDYKIDVIHSQDRLTSPAAIMAAKKNKIKSVAHFRDYWFCCPKSSCFRSDYKNCQTCNFSRLLKCKPYSYFFFNLYKLAYLKKIRKLLNYADAKIAVSNAVKNRLLESGINSVEVIHNARNKSDFSNSKQGFRKKYGLAKKDIALLFSGSLFYTKGIDFILPVVKRIIEENSNVYLFIAGDGPLLKKISAFIIKNNLQKRIFLLGRIGFKEVPEIYSSSDIILLPSLWEEPFSGIILEAMCSGKPLVASNIGGMKDVNIGKFGYLIAPLDKNAWYNAISTLIKNSKLRKKFGKMAIRECKNYSPDKIAKEVEEVYLSLR